ncbi:uncharacterized protein LOC111365460 isoform X1 [Olea europaea var. sylvestris]|uniref:uncharacterized protein LOC111365460 isoform X1 n=1 Tax=Olea europaea var. sylvestris TaxID=158386 RepID=UPI000C1CE681|nr:uncharacterized protein LOC111365460 isoform X1 [Olea europaea var. sylvestris]
MEHVWAYEAVPEIGKRFGQRVGEQMPRLLRWSARKQPQHRTYDAFFKNVWLHVYATLRPTDAEAEQQYFSTLVPYDDPPVPVLDKIARNVVGPQFNASHGGSGSGGQLVRQESDDGVSSRGGGEDDMSGDEGADAEESGEGASERSSVGADTCRGQTGASSTPPATDVSSPVRGPTMETRPVGTSGSGVTKEEVEEMLFDQRILFEMRLRTVKLEIEQHVTFECKKLRAFFATLVAPPAPTPVPAAMPADTEGGVSGSIPQDMNVQYINRLVYNFHPCLTVAHAPVANIFSIRRLRVRNTWRRNGAFPRRARHASRYRNCTCTRWRRHRGSTGQRTRPTARSNRRTDRWRTDGADICRPGFERWRSHGALTYGPEQRCRLTGLRCYGW